MFDGRAPVVLGGALAPLVTEYAASSPTAFDFRNALVSPEAPTLSREAPTLVTGATAPSQELPLTRVPRVAAPPAGEPAGDMTGRPGDQAPRSPSPPPGTFQKLGDQASAPGLLQGRSRTFFEAPIPDNLRRVIGGSGGGPFIMES